MPLLLKERACLVYEKGTENPAIQMLHFFFCFIYLLKDRKKTCSLQNAFFLRKWNLFATEGMKIYLFHLSLCMLV